MKTVDVDPGAMIKRAARKEGLTPTRVAVIVDKSEGAARQWMRGAAVSGKDLIYLMAAIPALRAEVMAVVNELASCSQA